MRRRMRQVVLRLGRIDRELEASAADEAAGNLADFDRTAAELSFQRK